MQVLVFDSGVGGLSVAADIRRLLPDVCLSYAADDAFRPYGDKSETALQLRLPGLIWSLVRITSADLVVLACNTASTAALDDIRAVLDVPVVGVVPAVKPAAAKTKTGVMAVLGTPGTVSHPYVDQLIADFARNKHVHRLGSTALVGWAEDKLAGRNIPAASFEAEVEALAQIDELDTVVLACTHFPLLKTELSKALPGVAHWVDSGAAIARRVKSLLPARPKSVRPCETIAFLIGPDADAERQTAFRRFGFENVIGLEP